jgi:hypothetical protein
MTSLNSMTDLFHVRQCIIDYIYNYACRCPNDEHQQQLKTILYDNQYPNKKNKVNQGDIKSDGEVPRPWRWRCESTWRMTRSVPTIQTPTRSSRSMAPGTSSPRFITCMKNKGRTVVIINTLRFLSFVCFFPIS